MSSPTPPASPEQAAPRKNRRRLFGCLTVGAVLLLGGCGGLIALGYSVDDPQSASTATPSASPLETSSAPETSVPAESSAPTEPTPEPTEEPAAETSAPAEPTAEPVPAGGDVTAQFLATPWGQQFEGVVMDVDQEFTDDGTTMRLEADTNLVDPRGADGSAPAVQAVEICEALKSAFRDDWGKLFSVYVNEADGTVFATNKAPGGSGCSEY
ncbi:hypothetical protein KFL01_29830 [Kocuria flava]|uniref:DUF306 domain-containing protein n=2 Tax=Kocuria flava TaxID=446860 RepID=A0ABQ0X7S8_9MICC|nr:hypothetical protein KFL01_29830 [Kocuria flava]